MRERDVPRGARRLVRGLGERLSYANVMATIAVFGVLAGGGAYAASTIGPGDIKKNAVRSKHIKTGEVKRPDLAKDLKPRFASVTDGGTLESGRGVVSATRTGEGTYVITFDRNVTDCAPAVTKGAHGTGVIDLGTVPFASTGGSGETAMQVRVDFREPVSPFAFDDTDFHLIVPC
jgi:hypothetical protein